MSRWVSWSVKVRSRLGEGWGGGVSNGYRQNNGSRSGKRLAGWQAGGGCRRLVEWGFVRPRAGVVARAMPVHCVIF